MVITAEAWWIMAGFWAAVFGAVGLYFLTAEMLWRRRERRRRQLMWDTTMEPLFDQLRDRSGREGQ